MQIEKTRSNLLLVNLTAIPPQPSSPLAFSSYWRNQLMRMQQTCHAGLKLLLPGTYQGGHLCNCRWKVEKLNCYSLSNSQILILECMYSMLLGSISSQMAIYVKNKRGERGARGKWRYTRKRQKERNCCAHGCACSKTPIASVAFNDILLVYFLQLHEWTVLETS